MKILIEGAEYYFFQVLMQRGYPGAAQGGGGMRDKLIKIQKEVRIEQRDPKSNMSLPTPTPSALQLMSFQPFVE